MITDYKGDSATYKFAVTLDGVVEDITGWPIVAEFGDSAGNEVKKATANIAGGGDTQIKITDAAGGLFEVYLLKGETTNFSQKGYIEVAMLEGTQKDTLYFSDITFNLTKIDWETP